MRIGHLLAMVNGDENKRIPQLDTVAANSISQECVCFPCCIPHTGIHACRLVVEEKAAAVPWPSRVTPARIIVPGLVAFSSGGGVEMPLKVSVSFQSKRFRS